MHLLKNMSIQRKQTLIIMLTSTVVLLLACAAFCTSEVLFFRRNMVEQLTSMAEILGNNTAAALDFNDATAATEALSGLKSEAEIIGAAIYTKNGELFAQYSPKSGDLSFQPPPIGKDGHLFAKRRLILSRPISHNGEFLGVIYLESDMRELYARLTDYVGIVTMVLVASLLIALALSNSLQRLVSGPILKLAQVARSVAVEKDYSVRAIPGGHDELGQLVDGFNEMLAQIQKRDIALQAERDNQEKRIEERTKELVVSVSLLNATLESTTDGILVIDGQGQITNINDQFVTMWRMVRSEGIVGNKQLNLASLISGLKSPDVFLKKMAEMQANPDAESFDVLEFTDGRIFERYSKPQRIGRESVGRVWSFRDVTQRKKSEADLAEMHKQLLVTSRQAGMAEVAVSVLHNVGNVLNSVNVSASVITDRMQSSKSGNVGKIAAMLSEHANDLGAYLTADPKGRQLPDYLTRLAEYLAKEKADILKETGSLRSNVDHIKEIVAMQQTYAKVSGVTEIIAVEQLVEDSLQMTASTRTRHNVQVLREFGSNLPKVTVDKHKTLQILVNLIRNAKQACDASESNGKRIAIRLTQVGEKMRIVVNDNGIGIPPENMDRLFNHGFTTKRDGHGFGLHSSALAAQELGGALTVQSEGTGKGATFTLDLPLQPPDRKQTPQPQDAGFPH